MSYKLEGKDIVINGFEQGVADTPYSGISDMRNIELLAVPGEASVALGTSAVVKPVAMNAVAFTAQNAGDTITLASVTGLYVGTAIVLNTNTATGLAINTVYYVRNIVGNTFQVSVAPALATPVTITTDGSGTLTTYQFPGTSPVSYFIDKKGNLAGSNAVWLTDSTGKVWVILSATQGALSANTLYFMGNIGGIAASGNGSINGISIWNGFVILFGVSTTDIADVNDVWLNDGPLVAWDYSWEGIATNSNNSTISTLVSFEDGNQYWTSADGLGSIIETPGDNFDPGDATSYSITSTALVIPEIDDSTCIAELGSNLLIGGRNSFVYVWDKISLGFNNLLNVPDSFTTRIIATSQNAYVFAGIRGRIYITNGSGIDLYKKFPDYLTGVLNPKIRWLDANFSRNQLIFSLSAQNPASTTLNTVAGVWGIDLESDALRMINKTSDTAYTGTVRMVAEQPPDNSSAPTGDSVVGYSLVMGWYGASASSIDVSSAIPYTGGESYLETDMIPVGTYLNPLSPTQIEWKTSAPLVNGESISIYWRENISSSFTLLGTSTVSGTTLTGTTTGATANAKRISDYYKANFSKVQWVQLKAILTSTNTTPSYCRLTEIRVRDYPSGNANK